MIDGRPSELKLWLIPDMALLQHPLCKRRLWLASWSDLRKGCLLSSYSSVTKHNIRERKQNPLNLQSGDGSVIIHSKADIGSHWFAEKDMSFKFWKRVTQGYSCLSVSPSLLMYSKPSGIQQGFPSMVNFRNVVFHPPFFNVGSPKLSFSCFQKRTVVTSAKLFEPKTHKTAKNVKLWQDEEEKSKVEEAVEAMKQKKETQKEKVFPKEQSPEQVDPAGAVAPTVKKTLWQKIKDEFLRTASDIFRLVPFLVFLLIPFMEFMLPVAVKLFPNMLPSTFEDKSKKEENRKKQLKVKIQMAKFLQDTIEEMAVTAKKKKTQEVVSEFANFFEKIRRKGEQPSNEEIVRFSKLFEDQITLDNMSRAQLKAINRLLMLPTIGTNNYLRFQLRMKLRQLRADDLLIQRDGVDSLTVQELQSACQARGMRAIGVPTARLRSQLYQVEEAEIKIAEVSGEKVANKVRLDVLKKEEQMIAEEKEELLLEEEEKKKKASPITEIQIEAIATEILEELRELATEDEIQNLKESVGSSRLGKKVDAMINKIEKRLKLIEEEIDGETLQQLDADGDGKISLQEMISALRRVQNAPSESKCQKMAEILDPDQDGTLDLRDVEKVLDLLSSEEVDIASSEIRDIVNIVTTESRVRQAEGQEG
ncbi:Mitochondrial proton/calcium exchanger protein [Acropora cervicornis]|uniref:Mitochondrial proton/calcium exchanger protein n=1 Tax=Acropora cervicornis TaxID=6130 RepID=A0AAD9V210_ACRCE|nr:Mitochondrial proton/calcium exchanger protein [Acropora cervicornis]